VLKSFRFNWIYLKLDERDFLEIIERDLGEN
jgi:hypothetical protein